MLFHNSSDINQMSDLPDTIIRRLDQWLTSRPYNHRKYILPEYFSDDNQDISYDIAREAMYLAVRIGVLKTNYEIHCPQSGDVVCIVHRQMDIPDEVRCDECNYVFNPLNFKSLIIISFGIVNGEER